MDGGKRPLIGIVCGDLSPAAAGSGPLSRPRPASFLPGEVVEAVVRAGGYPVLLPSLPPSDEWLPPCDGLLLPGGPDPDPLLFGEEPLPGTGRISPARDAWELFLCRAFLRLRRPILGLCRGAQMLNLALGGDIYQDLASQYDHPLKHFQDAPDEYPTHSVSVEPGSRLSRILGPSSLAVNSWHHQAVRRPGRGVHVAARAADGVIEALEVEEHPFALGVQWHPEHMAAAGDQRQSALFQAFVQAASR